MVFSAGQPGSCNLAYVNEGRRSTRELSAKETVQLGKGDTYTTYPSGGGGWGNPRERDREAVREDARNQIVSREAAQSRTAWCSRGRSS